MLKRLVLLTIVLLALIGGAAQAQGSELPLILWIRGDLYSADSLDQPPTPITSSGTIANPVLSPDGQTIAYRVASPVGVEALGRLQAAGKIANLDLPGDIAVIDLASRQITTLAQQPADASLFVPGVPDKAVIRSTPQWSPDGKRLAWTEFDFPGGQPRLVIYDRASSALTTLVSNLPAPLVQGAAPSLRWGSGWIAVGASGDAAGEQDFLIYDEHGQLLSDPRLAAVPNDTAISFVAIRGAGRGDLGVLYGSSGWILIDPASGVAQAASQPPRLTTAAPNSLALTFGVDPTEGMFWEVVDGNAAAAAPPDKVTLSPSGQQIAFIGTPSSGAVTVLKGSDGTAIPGTGSNLDELQVGSVFWGYTFWQMG